MEEPAELTSESFIDDHPIKQPVSRRTRSSNTSGKGAPAEMKTKTPHSPSLPSTRQRSLS